MEEETHRRRSSADVFSFPRVSDHNPVGERHSPTTESSFPPPPPPPPHPHALPLSRGGNGSSDRSKQVLARASSASSKDSSIMTPSRSSSTGSRSSSCNSARTSSSDVSERRLLTKPKLKDNYPQKKSASSPSPRVFESPRRWHLIAPLPPLKPEVSRRKKAGEGGCSPPEEEAASMVDKGNRNSRKSWLGRRMLRSFVSTCKECHHIEPSKKREIRLH